MSRIAAGIDVLAARVKVDDQVLSVAARQVGRALQVLHGMPVPGLQVVADIEYLSMPAAVGLDIGPCRGKSIPIPWVRMYTRPICTTATIAR